MQYIDGKSYIGLLNILRIFPNPNIVLQNSFEAKAVKFTSIVLVHQQAMPSFVAFVSSHYQCCGFLLCTKSYFILNINPLFLRCCGTKNLALHFRDFIYICAEKYEVLFRKTHFACTRRLLLFHMVKFRTAV